MISDVYFPRVNGVSTSISVFRRELTRLGHEVTLIAPDYPGAVPEPGILRIPSRYLFIDPEDRIMGVRPLLALTGQLRAAQYDLVHIQTPFLAHWLGVRLARRLGLPTVETYHTFFEEYLYCYVSWLPREWLRGLARRVTRSQCNAVDAVVVPSSAMGEVLRRYGVTTRAAVLPTGIELDQFQAGDGARFRARYGIAPDRPVLLYVGRVAYEKNIGFLLEVAARVRQQHPSVLLVVAGEGPARPALERQAQALGLAESVLFVGYLDRAGELQECYRAGDLFVFASRTETQGLVLLEAMALGVPVVSTAVMGTRDVVRDGAGAAVAEDAVEPFAALTSALLADPERRATLAAAARRYAEEWSAGALAERMAEFYTQLIEVCASEPVPAERGSLP